MRAARVLLGWSQIELGKRAKVAIGTIRRMESFDGEIVSYTSTLSKVMDAMEAAGIEFLNSGEPGVRLRAVPRGASPAPSRGPSSDRRKV
jgi:transcriptional regulator with XRE-family HTH domain